MSKALIFETVEEAEARSRQAWEDTLGRPKNPEDGTEFLWDVVAIIDEKQQAVAGACLVADPNDSKLAQEEKSELVEWVPGADVSDKTEELGAALEGVLG